MPSTNTEGHINAEGLADLWERISTLFAKKAAVKGNYLNKTTTNSQTVAGSVTFSREITALAFNGTSTLASKDNVHPYEDSAVDLINTVDIVGFNFKDDEAKTPKVGFIADFTNELLASPDHNKMDLYNCVGLLLKAVQELSAQNSELAKEIDKLKNVSK